VLTVDIEAMTGQGTALSSLETYYVEDGCPVITNPICECVQWKNQAGQTVEVEENAFIFANFNYQVEFVRINRSISSIRAGCRESRINAMYRVTKHI